MPSAKHFKAGTLEMTVELEAAAEFLTGNRHAVEALPWRMLGRDDLLVLREWAGETLSQSAQRRLMRELRQAIRRALEVEDEQPPGAYASPAILRARRRPAVASPISGRQVRVLIEARDEDEDAGVRRSAAVMALMLFGGLRRREVVDLQRGDYEDDEGRVRVDSRGRHARSVMLAGDARHTVERWLTVRGDWPGPLIAALSPGGEVLQRGISPTAVNRLIAKRSVEAGCSGLTPSDLRARFLWQLRSASRQGRQSRYYQDEDGRAAWVLPAIDSA
jgi:integrase